MTAIAPYAHEPRGRVRSPRYLAVDDATLGELCAELFASLPRSDQRAKGSIYVRGLLRAEGRKSIRKLALVSGGRASEQGLHHFVCDSTWDWMPVREVLARHVSRVLPVHALVVRPMVTPKAGEHSVGVEHRFSTELGRLQGAQHSVGVWLASDEMSCPVNWRLRLPRAWLDDAERRSRAAIPDDLAEETPGDCAVSAYLETARFRGLPARPVVMDARQTDTAAVVRGLGRARRPLMVRVGADLVLRQAGPVSPAPGDRPVTAQQILTAVRELRRPVYPPGPDLAGVLVATVPVRLPQAGGQELCLLGEWAGRHGSPKAYWLTDLSAANPGSLLALTRLVDRVDEDLERITDRVGIREHSGRSYDGWHRHVTLASAAHAVATLSTIAFPRSDAV